MMRVTNDGHTKFCYGLFIAAVIASAVIGVIVAQMFGAEYPDKMVLWASAALGGNLGPLAVDLLRKVIRF